MNRTSILAQLGRIEWGQQRHLSSYNTYQTKVNKYGERVDLLVEFFSSFTNLTKKTKL